MFTILCYGASNVWGFIPGSYRAETGLATRYSKAVRWTGYLQAKLDLITHGKFNVIEEGMNGRTTSLDDPNKADRNGLTVLPSRLETHYPIDLVIFMIGINDTKIQFNQSASKIAEGMLNLVKLVKTSNKGLGGLAPKILIISQQPILLTSASPQFDENSVRKSQQLADFYNAIAQKENCSFLDAGTVVTSSLIDGLHLSEKDHAVLGDAIFQKMIGLGLVDF